MERETKFIVASSALGIALIGVLGAVAWQNYMRPAPVGGDSVKTAPAPAVKNAPRKKVASAPVETIQGDAEANLKLPDSVRRDPNKFVTSATQVAPSLRPQTLSTVLDTKTGLTETYAKTDPYPWFAIENRGDVAVGVGYKYRATEHTLSTVGRLQFNYDPVRVKALTVTISATADSDRDLFGGVFIRYKF